MPSKAAISSELWGSLPSFLDVDRIVSCGCRTEAPGHSPFPVTWPFEIMAVYFFQVSARASAAASPLLKIYLISSDLPMIITLLINSKSTEFSCICKIPSPLPYNVKPNSIIFAGQLQGRTLLKGVSHWESSLNSYCHRWNGHGNLTVDFEKIYLE